MLTVHHLNNSRSQRILWLLEELGTPYEIVKYQRMRPMPLAPPELKEVHPLGKSPVITDGGKTIAESGAIVEYIIDTYGNGRLKPQARQRRLLAVRRVDALRGGLGDAAAAARALRGAPRRRRGAAAPAHRRRDRQQPVLHRERLSQGASSSSATISPAPTSRCSSSSRPRALASSRTPALVAYRDRMHARPAYQRGIEKGGPYQLMSR